MKKQSFKVFKFFTLIVLILSFTVAPFSPYLYIQNPTKSVLFTPTVAEAQGLLGGLFGGANRSTRTEQIRQIAVARAQLGLDAQNTTANVGNFLLENTLDGIAWTIAKTVLTSMVRSLINWVNSGFQGSPAFITDLKQFLLDALDVAAGEFIRSLGEFGEFICSPFRLDVQAAIATSYAQSRTGMPTGPDQSMCRLSEIGSNIENFFSGMSTSWNDWLQVTSNPNNTPLGSYFGLEASLNIRLINEAGREIEIARWGSGMMSLRMCEAIEGRSGTGNCTITTPGRVISEALTFSTTAGPRTLIEADEINELVGALLNQLILQAVQGINGLLGLGGNAAYASYDGDGRTFLDNLESEANQTNESLLPTEISRNITIETSYLGLLDQVELLSTRQIAEIEAEIERAAATDPDGTTGTSSLLGTLFTNNSEATIEDIRGVQNEARALRPRVAETLTTLEDIQNQLNSLSGSASTTAEITAVRTETLTRYSQLNTQNALSNEATVLENYRQWREVIDNLRRPTF